MSRADDSSDAEGLPAEIAALLKRGDFAKLSGDECAKLEAWLKANARKRYGGLAPANLAKTRRREEAKRRLRAVLAYNMTVRQADTGESRAAAQAVAVEGPTDQAQGPMAWREAQEKLLGMVERGEAYTSVQKLADRLRCSPSTVHKAVAGSRRLKRWQAEGSRTQRAPRAQGLNRAIEDGKPGKGPDPAEVAEEHDLLDNVFARLLDEATDEERAALNAKPLSEQRELARVKLEQEKDQAAQESGPERNDPAYRNPKRRGNRLLGRKP